MLLDLRALRPVRLEFAVAEFQILHDLGVPRHEVIAGTCFEELLLNGEPGGLVDPNLDVVNLLAHFRGVRGEIEHGNLVTV